jgi:hypothetical protein
MMPRRTSTRDLGKRVKLIPVPALTTGGQMATKATSGPLATRGRTSGPLVSSNGPRQLTRESGQHSDVRRRVARSHRRDRRSEDADGSMLVGPYRRRCAHWGHVSGSGMLRGTSGHGRALRAGQETPKSTIIVAVVVAGYVLSLMLAWSRSWPAAGFAGVPRRSVSTVPGPGGPTT